VGTWSHACPWCGGHADWVCMRCTRCEDCCSCKGAPTLISRLSRDAQTLIRRAVAQSETERETRNPSG